MIKTWIQNHKQITVTASAIIAFVLNFLTEKYLKIGIDFTNISNSSIIVIACIAISLVFVYKGEYEIFFLTIVLLGLAMGIAATIPIRNNEKFESCIHKLSKERKESLSEITQTCATIYKTKSTEN